MMKKKDIAFKFPFFGDKLESLYKSNQTLKSNFISYISQDSIWLFTIPKSGTTYAMLFLVNYMGKTFANLNTRIGYKEMMDRYFIHTIHNYAKKNDLAPFLRDRLNLLEGNTPYKELVSTHTMVSGGLWRRNISLYRNPLDFVVSIFYYKYKNRGASVGHPRDVLEKELKHWINLYNQQLDLKREYGDKVLLLSYEEVYRNPKDSFSTIIDFLEIPFDGTALEYALDASSSDSLKKEEKKEDSAVVAPKEVYSGSFVRSGKIGQWREYFNSRDIEKVDSILKKNNISLADFILE